MASPLLVETTVNTVINHGMLTRLNVTVVDVDGDGEAANNDYQRTANPATLCLMVLPSIPIHEIKSLIAERLGIPEQEQRLSLLPTRMAAAATAEEEQLLLYGPLYKYCHSGDDEFSFFECLEIQLTRVPIDPCLQSLYEILKLHDWKDRDEIMAHMISGRHPKACFCGKMLVQRNVSPAERAVETGNPLECAKCHFWIDEHSYPPSDSGDYWYWICPSALQQKNRGDSPCDCGSASRVFGLHTNCYDRDTGVAASLFRDQQRAHQSFLAWTWSVARNIIFAPKRVHGPFCADTQPQYPFHFAPSAARQGSIFLNRQSQILPNNIQIVVRFHIAICSVLQELGRDDLREKAEISQRLPQGATCEEMSDIVREWQTSSPELWSILKEEWNRRYGVVLGTEQECMEEALGWMLSPGLDATPVMKAIETRLISFQTYKVVFEIVLPTAMEDDL